MIIAQLIGMAHNLVFVFNTNDFTLSHIYYTFANTGTKKGAL